MLFSRGKKASVVYTLGAKVLRQKAERIAGVTPEIRQMAADMLKAMHDFDGIGLAAPQYGQSLRLVVFDVPSRGNSGSPGEMILLPQMPVTVINPEIIWSSSDTNVAEEGCLSLPQIYAEVERPERVLFRADTLDGEHIEIECGGLLGRCIQHELDHLEGVVFTDRANDAEKRRIRGDMDNLLKSGQGNNYRRIKK